MIVVRLNGGLGNQMFQYAAAKAVALKAGEELLLDKTFTKYYPFNSRITRRVYELDLFQVEETNWVNKDQLFKLAKNKYIYNILHYINIKKLALRELTEQNFSKSDNLSNVYLKGFFQSEIYFQDIRQTLLDSFSIRNDVGEKNKQVASLMQNKESVSIHIRRGDYLLAHHKAHHGILGLDYYKKAIDKIAANYDDPHFFVFSDDLKWAEANLVDSRFDFDYIGHNTGKNSYLDMWLMSQCKHNIIANSSFSWWGAWLNINEEKIVIGPNNWFAAKEQNVIPNSWIKL